MSYTLDTNIILHILKNSRLVPKIRELFEQDANPFLLISIVTRAELISIAIQRKWGEKKLKSLHDLLNQFLTVPVDSDQLVNKYAEIDSYSQGKLPDMPLPKGVTSINMGKNDLWIASTASVTGSRLITTDQDFNHLNKVFLEVTVIDQKEI